MPDDNLQVAPVVSRYGILIRLKHLSIAEESGWRPLQRAVVQQYISKAPGDYGRSLQRNVRVLVDDKTKYLHDSEGNILLDDGKSTVAALKQLVHSCTDNPDFMKEVTPALKEVVDTGRVVCDLVCYKSTDTMLRLLHNSLAHDEESNDFLASSIANNVCDDCRCMCACHFRCEDLVPSDMFCSSCLNNCRCRWSRACRAEFRAETGRQ